MAENDDALAAEVARIKAETAARDAAWLAAIRARLEQGSATSRELSEACGCGAEEQRPDLLKDLFHACIRLTQADRVFRRRFSPLRMGSRDHLSLS